VRSPGPLAVWLALLVAGPAVATPTLPGADPPSEAAPHGPVQGPPTGTGPSTPDQPEPSIVAVKPNPVAPEDRGEYVVVTYPRGANWTLGDGETRVELPAGAGRAVVTPNPAAVNLSGTVVAVPDLRLANGAEILRLRHGRVVVDRVTYETAPESEVYHPHDGGWRAVGATNFGPATTGPATVEAFVLPDAPSVPLETVQAADRRLLLAGYTVGSWRLARALAAAADRGATVRVLVEGGPVGGISRRSARLLDWLAARGVAVEVLDGPRARYAFHHAKYVVADDRALVLTENFEPTGTGGHSNRGWGVVVRDADTAAHLAAVFRADTGWRDTVGWQRFRAGRNFTEGGVANATYPSRFRPRELHARSVRLLVAPDNAEAGIVRAVRSAEKSVLVKQVAIGGRDQPFLQAALDAARRGVRVRVLLSSAWYVEEDNRRLVEWLNGLAADEGLPIAARLAEPRSRYGKIHAKGAVVDGDTVVLGSVNWNNHSVRENREVDVVLEGEAVGSYYERVFWADWRGGTRQLPLGVVVTVVGVGAGAVAGARRVRFERRGDGM
jgi:phosphatidylserine/phosphatidylglycerophosphate/cardiolipin synthase-like enzyme